MRKTIGVSILLLVLGTIIGNGLYNKLHTSFLEVFKENNSCYFIQEGIYSNYDLMFENTKDIDIKLIEKENNKYYVYLGISSNLDNANKLKDIYEKEGYKVRIKEVNLNNEEFYTNLVQFDLLIDKTSSDNEILTIEEVILANYEEIIRKGK